MTPKGLSYRFAAGIFVPDATRPRYAPRHKGSLAIASLSSQIDVICLTRRIDQTDEINQIDESFPIESPRRSAHPTIQ